MKGLCIPVQCIRVSESSPLTVLTFSFYGNFFLISSYLISCVSFSFSPPHCCPLHFHFHLHSNISKMLTILQIHVRQPPVIIVCTASSNQTTLLMTFKMALLIINTFLFSSRCQNKKLTINWEAWFISSLVLFQVEVHNLRSRCWKILNSRVSTETDGFFRTGFHYGFLWNCARTYGHMIILHVT